MDRTEIANILAAAGAKPRHQLGQNFMVDQAALRAVADAGEVGEADVLLEVGPGVGNLTRLLAQRASRGHVLAVDIDRILMSAAQRHHASLANVTWLHADVLAGKHEIEPLVLAKLRELRRLYPAGSLKLVSNLPYNAASPLVAELLVAMWREMRAISSQSCPFRESGYFGQALQAPRLRTGILALRVYRAVGSWPANDREAGHARLWSPWHPDPGSRRCTDNPQNRPRRASGLLPKSNRR